MSEYSSEIPPPDWQRHHERPRPQAWRWLLAALIVLLLLAAAVGGASWLTHGRHTVAAPDPSDSSDASPQCSAAASLRVTAAPEIAPVVEAAARTLNPSGATCGPVAVTAEEPAVTLAAAHQPDVWIPSSSLWLQVAASDKAAYSTKGDPLAYSPIVLAAPTTLGSLFIKDGKTSWAGLTEAASRRRLPALSMPDATDTTVGLLSLYAVGQAMNRTTTDAGVAQLRALTLRSHVSDPTTPPAATIQRLEGETDATSASYDVGVFPTTAQQLAAYDAGKHPVALTGAPPIDGLVDEDYPFAVSKSAADPDLVSKLRSALSKSLLTEAGFSTTPTKGALAATGTPAALLTAAQQWQQYRTLKFQVLLLIDASGSMNQKITDKSGQSTTKAALLQQSSISANQLFSDDSSIGMWFFGTAAAQGPPYVEEVPVGPIDASLDGKTRREVLAAKMAAYKPANNAGTPLYQTVLDGESQMISQSRQGTVSLVIVLTDGDDKQTKYAMSQSAFMTKLAAERDPARPVPIIAVGYGPTANMKALTAMATATGGKAISAVNPADLATALTQAFLAAHQQG